MEALELVGLTRSEAAVYLALLDLGTATTGPIIKRAGIAAGKAYLVLDRLALKGLVTHTVQGGRKRFQASEPARLLDYVREQEEALHERERALEKALPQLQARFARRGERPSTEVYEGLRGLKTFYEWALTELHKGEWLDVLGMPREGNEKLEQYLAGWNRRRIAQGVRLRVLFHPDAQAFGAARERMALTEVRYLRGTGAPAWLEIGKDWVATIHVHGTPVCFFIRSREVAEAHRSYFDLLWKQAAKRRRESSGHAKASDQIS